VPDSSIQCGRHESVQIPGLVTNQLGRSVYVTLGCFVLAFAAGVRPLARPQPPQQPPTFQSSVDVVRVEASVLDKERRPIRGLTAADFTVRENGQERPIVAFAPVELPAPAATGAGGGWLQDAPRDVVSNAGTDAGRLIVIAFDWSIRFYDLAVARRIALAAVDRLGPADEATVLFTRPNAAAGKPQGFTPDHARLRAAINQPFALALTDPHPDTSGQIIDPEGYNSGDCQCGICTLETLTQLGQTLRTVSERPKVVLFIGTYVRAVDEMRPAPVPVVPEGQIRPSFSTLRGTTDCSRRLDDARQAFEQSMGEANITVHVLDPVGLDSGVSSPLGPGRTRERLDSLPIIADMTGGRTVTNTPAPEDQIAAIFEESSAYYILGFTPAPGRKDTTRRIEVRVRPGLVVKARNQYSAVEQPEAGRRREDALSRAVGRVLPTRDLPLELSAVPMIAGTKGAAVLVARVPPGVARPTTMISAAFTPRAAPVTSRRIAIPSAAGDGGDATGLALVSALALEPGSYEIRLGAEHSGSAAGSVHTFVDISDFRQAPLWMSGVLFHVAPEEPGVPRSEIDGALPFVPTARRSFASSDTVSAFVQVSQGTGRKDALQSVTVRLRIDDTQATAVRTQTGALSPAQFGSNRTANSRLTLPLRDLPPGQYLLTLEAALGDRRIERQVRFELR
jgi:VWFA-related protein